jgi:hypothetical protein
LADKFLSSVHQEIEWQQLDTKTNYIQVKDYNEDKTLNVIQAGTGTDEANDGWTSIITIPPTGQITRDISHLPLVVYGRTIHKDFESIIGLTVYNQSSGNLIVGSSGVSNSVEFFGYQSLIGPSGNASTSSELGITIGPTTKNIGIYNPNLYSIQAHLSVIGART